jgi:hypothetical protein
LIAGSCSGTLPLSVKIAAVRASDNRETDPSPVVNLLANPRMAAAAIRYPDPKSSASTGMCPSLTTQMLL